MEVDITLAGDLARFLSCIGEPTRLCILKLLANGEKCVSDIVEALNIEQPLVSHHLKALKSCNIITGRPAAQKVYYELADPRLAELILKAESIMKELCLCSPEQVPPRGDR